MNHSSLRDWQGRAFTDLPEDEADVSIIRFSRDGNSLSTPTELEAALYEFQKDDSDYLLHLLKTKQGAFNFNCMGSGKTIEAIHLVERLGIERVLILCPNSLRLNWAKEIKMWTREEAAVTKSDPYRRWNDWYRKDRRTKKYQRKDTRFFISNIESARTPDIVELFNALEPQLLIVDEAHKLRNPETRQARGIQNIKVDMKLLMTGSPVVNSAFDVFSLLHLLDPITFFSPSQFRYQFTWGFQTRYGWRTGGTKNASILRTMLAERGVQRSKEDVLPFLPEKRFETIPLEMSSEQRKVYEAMENELFIMLDDGEPLWAASVLAQTTRLRQILCDPRLLGKTAPSIKTEDLVNHIDREGKTVVFTTFEQYTKLLEPVLQEADLRYVRITGKESSEQQQRNNELFQNEPGIQVCLGTIQSMGEGRNLQASDHVVFLDRWWNPAGNNQAIDRLHRIGQHHPVLVTTLVAEDSFDQAMDEILQRKQKQVRELEIRQETVNLLREMRRKRGKR